MQSCKKGHIEFKKTNKAKIKESKKQVEKFKS